MFARLVCSSSPEFVLRGTGFCWCNCVYVVIEEGECGIGFFLRQDTVDHR